MAAADSIKTISDHLVRRIHSRDPSAGRLYKGHGLVAANASIPSKYQTIVIDNSERRGFGRQAQRFQYDLFSDENPGPGSYSTVASTIDNDKPSYSKKGTGGFASKDRRIQKQQINPAPAAGVYNIATDLQSKRDFNKSTTTRTFATPIAVKRDKVEKRPGPSAYNVLNTHTGPSNNVSANAAFKSRTRREVIDIKEAASRPAPGQYSPSDQLLHHSVKVPYSSFKSTSNRKMSSTPVNNPGPGAYSPENPPKTPVMRQEYPKKHYLCISAPAMPLPPALPGPAPGSYNLVNYQGEPKSFMSGSVFVSNTSRWTGKVGNAAELPGPAHYSPSYVQAGRQSFIYNAQGRWI